MGSNSNKIEQESHKQKTISGISWNVLNQIISQGTNIGIGILLARLLGPKAFGLVGMITVFTGFLNVFSNFGLGSALIQKKNINSVDKSTVFWVNLGVGVLLCLTLFVSSSAISNFYNEPLLSPLVRFISFIFIIQSLNYVQASLFKRALAFKKIFWVNTLSVIVGGILAVIMAYQGYGVWSLVFHTIFKMIINTIVLWFLSDWKPILVFSKASLKELMRFSLPLMGTQTFNYWVRNIDNLLIGKYLGTAQLGYYSRAYSLMLLPVSKISGVIAAVMFPSLSLIQDQKKRIKSIYLKMSRFIALVTFFVASFFFLGAKPFVLVILGEEWIEAIPIIKILSLLSALQSISTLNGNIFLSQGATALQLKVRIISGAITISFIFLGLQYGIKGVAVCYALSTLLTTIPVWHIMGKLINCSVKDIMLNLASLFLINIFMILSGEMLNIFILNEINPFKHLIIIVLYTTSIYWILIQTFKPAAYGEMLGLLKEQLRKKKS